MDVISTEHTGKSLHLANVIGISPMVNTAAVALASAGAESEKNRFVNFIFTATSCLAT